MMFDYDQWQSDLAKLISATLAEFNSRADDEMEVFALECTPWNGMIVLAFLTKSELKDSPILSDLSEMAAWKYFDFSADLSSWQPALGVASRMRPPYEAAGEDNRQDVTRQFFQRCAKAVASKRVQDRLANYRLTKNFKITVQHPDTAEEFYPPPV